MLCIDIAHFSDIYKSKYTSVANKWHLSGIKHTRARFWLHWHGTEEAISGHYEETKLIQEKAVDSILISVKKSNLCMHDLYFYIYIYSLIH